MAGSSPPTENTPDKRRRRGALPGEQLVAGRSRRSSAAAMLPSAPCRGARSGWRPAAVSAMRTAADTPALERLFAALARDCRRDLWFHRCGCGCVSQDEISILGMIAALQAGERCRPPRSHGQALVAEPALGELLEAAGELWHSARDNAGWRLPLQPAPGSRPDAGRRPPALTSGARSRQRLGGRALAARAGDRPAEQDHRDQADHDDRERRGRGLGQALVGGEAVDPDREGLEVERPRIRVAGSSFRTSTNTRITAVSTLPHISGTWTRSSAPPGPRPRMRAASSRLRLILPSPASTVLSASARKRTR